jgi:hypothetical protein
MTAGLVSVVALGLMFSGGVLGLLIGRLLPEKYRGAPTERIVQGSLRMISYLAILVLGLLSLPRRTSSTTTITRSSVSPPT